MHFKAYNKMLQVLIGQADNLMAYRRKGQINNKFEQLTARINSIQSSQSSQSSKRIYCL